MDWAAVLDIGVVAIVIYYFLALIKDTRAFPMLVAGAGLLGLYYGTQWAQLETMRWLLTTLLPYFIFALIVIYQADIRRALARVGQVGLLRGRERTEVYDDIVLACSQLARRKVGTLIVLERQVRLQTFIESGIAMDARVTYDLLLSIFEPGGPLHDGAVIIRKNRIAAAGCFLPMSLNPLISAHLGARHRAAIGVTEEADCISGVVSEENGTIALVSSGTVELNLTPEQLRERMRALMHKGPGKTFS
jgi:diadenylate cyclase